METNDNTIVTAAVAAPLEGGDTQPSPDASWAYPVEAPAALAQPELAVRRRACVWGIIIGLAVSGVIAFAAPSHSMLGRMFDKTNVGTVIPVLISCLFFWGGAMCLLRRQRVRALASLEQNVKVARVLSRMEQIGLVQTEQELTAARLDASPTVRRVRVVLKQWSQKPDLQEADVVLQQQVEHDDEAIHAGYSLVRLFVWALPVVGLIGTVIGISLAVGGFANFLGGNIDDVTEIKRNLVSVTGGLSFAFLITLEGLATSLVLMFAASSIQNEEQRIYADVQRAITEEFLPCLQQLHPGPQPASSTIAPEVLEVWRTSLHATGQHMLEAIRETTQLAVGDLQSQQKDQRQYVVQLLQEFDQKTKEATDSIRGGTEAATQAMATGIASLAAEVKELQAGVTANSSSLSQLLDQNSARIDEQHRVLVDGVRHQLDLISASKAAMESLAATAHAAVTSQESIRKAMADLADSDLKQVFGGFAEAFRTQTMQLKQLNQVLSLLAQGTERMIDSHTKLQVATRELHETGLGQSLVSVRDSLAALQPVLEGFRGPFVFQAVPVAGND